MAMRTWGELVADGYELSGRIGTVDVLQRGSAFAFVRDDGYPAVVEVDFSMVPEEAVLVALTARYAALARGGDSKAEKMLEACRAAWRVHTGER